jgi:hypothetical protein
MNKEKPLFDWQDFSEKDKWRDFEKIRKNIYRIRGIGKGVKVYKIKLIKYRVSVYAGYDYIVLLKTSKGIMKAKLIRSGLRNLHLIVER